MKFLNVAFVAIAFTISSGFTSTLFETTTYYYKSGTPYQRLDWGHTNEPDSCARTISRSYFTNVNNWTTTAQSSTPASDFSQYIGSITFDAETTADGGSDGQLTLQEALNEVWDSYSSINTMDKSYIVDGNAVVKVMAVAYCH